MNYPSMLRHTLAFVVVVALILLAGCASPRTAVIENGQVKNITSAEATTLIKQDNRTKRANDVMENSKPIFKLTAQPGQTITLGGVQTLEVNVPLDTEVLMADSPDVTSENVQMFREVRGFARETIVPIALGAQILSDRKDSRAAGLEEARIRAAEREAQNASYSDTVRQVLEKDPVVITVPEGGSAGFLTRD